MRRINIFLIIAKKIFLIVLFILFVTNNVLCQSENENLISNELKSHGFENLVVKEKGNNIYIAFENRVFRFEVQAISEVLKLISKHCQDYKTINLLVQNKKTPTLSLTVSQSDLINWTEKNLSDSLFAEKMNVNIGSLSNWDNILAEDVSNSSNMKFDLVIKPSYKFQFGIYSDPVLYQLNFAPHIEFSLWKGMSGLYELTIPIHNDFSTREDSIRTSMISFNQVVRISNNFFISSSIGYFTQNRYGFDLETKAYFLNGNLSIGFNVGYTGYAAFSSNKLFYSNLYLWTGSANIEYRVSDYDLTVGLTAGIYLQKDKTIRVDIYRDFGEIQVGFFALRAFNGISNGGINISIPLFPAKYWKPGFLRIRTIENLTYSYLVKADVPDLIGLRYNTGFRLNNFIEKLNPSFIKNIFSKRLK